MKKKFDGSKFSEDSDPQLWRGVGTPLSKPKLNPSQIKAARVKQSKSCLGMIVRPIKTTHGARQSQSFLYTKRSQSQ